MRKYKKILKDRFSKFDVSDTKGYLDRKSFNHGPFNFFDRHGNVLCIGKYIHGQEVGVWKYYQDEGTEILDTIDTLVLNEHFMNTHGIEIEFDNQ